MGVVDTVVAPSDRHTTSIAASEGTYGSLRLPPSVAPRGRAAGEKGLYL